MAKLKNIRIYCDLVLLNFFLNLRKNKCFLFSLRTLQFNPEPIQLRHGGRSRGERITRFYVVSGLPNLFADHRHYPKGWSSTLIPQIKFLLCVSERPSKKFIRRKKDVNVAQDFIIADRVKKVRHKSPRKIICAS